MLCCEPVPSVVGWPNFSSPKGGIENITAVYPGRIVFDNSTRTVKVYRDGAWVNVESESQRETAEFRFQCKQYAANYIRHHANEIDL